MNIINEELVVSVKKFRLMNKKITLDDGIEFVILKELVILAKHIYLLMK